MASLRLLTLSAGLLAAASLAGAAQAAGPSGPPVVIDLNRSEVEGPGLGVSFTGPAGQQTATEIDFYPHQGGWPLGEPQSFDARSHFTAQQGASLSAGYQALSLQFYNATCCNSKPILDTGGLELVNPAPEPGSLPIWLGAGLLFTALVLRRQAVKPA